jgi:hypothetical protein
MVIGAGVVLASNEDLALDLVMILLSGRLAVAVNAQCIDQNKL